MQYLEMWLLAVGINKGSDEVMRVGPRDERSALLRDSYPRTLVRTQ